MNFYKSIKKSREKYVDTLARLYEYSTATFTNRPFLKLLDSDCFYTFGDFKKKCDGISKILSQYGVAAGDKVACFSQSMPNWAVAMFSTVPFGRIFVPILPDSSSNELENIINHSETKVLFVSQRCRAKVTDALMDKLTLVIDLDTFEFIKKDDESFTCDGRVAQPMPDDIACIIYTSGTTGKAKGVVLSHRNLSMNAKAAFHCYKCTEKDVFLSILPMAHTYELSIGFLYPMYVGASVHYISKAPTASVLIKAMNEVHPTVTLSVPLIIEKVYKSSVVPTIQKSRLLTWMDQHMHKLMCRIICGKLKKTFGGKLGFFGIGGAKLDPTVEKFLKDGKFPYAIGYGATEVAPLISHAVGRQTYPGSIGVPVFGVEMKLHNLNQETGEGEIVVRGDAVMLGYYKDPDRTRAAFTEDGWYRTNDLASIDEKGRYFIRGRLNNMILGPSGENIYPEEIENVLAKVEGVNESIVLERQGKLVALVNIDDKFIDWNQEGEDKFFDNLEARKKAILSYVNKHVNKTSNISEVEVMKEPFQKTATQKIRRFPYRFARGVSRTTSSEESAASVDANTKKDK